ncbi:MAG: hypothetical protein J7K54_02940 [Candidatus Aenigmarchaeota archaeon]|nr:hypothetical protein [Candidatus Aenigmarchaeota archaeon]
MDRPGGMKKMLSGIRMPQKLRKMLFRVLVRMMASTFVAFAVPFVAVAALGLVFQLVPWIFRTGVTDIDPLPVLLYALLAGFASAYVRYRTMKRFSRIEVYRSHENSDEKNDRASSKN